MFNLRRSSHRSKIRSQNPYEDLEQHLEADSCNCGVIPTFAQFIADESVYSFRIRTVSKIGFRSDCLR